MNARLIKIGNRRLLVLADFLEKLPRKRFDYGTWVGSDWKGKQDLSCGTTACAMGWAATIPQFRKLGLRLKAAGGYGTVGMPWSHCGWVGPTGAGMRVFHLTAGDFDRLFMWADEKEKTATPKYVARKLRAFVARREKEMNQ